MSDKERMDQLLSQLSGFTNLEDGYGCRTNLFADEMSELIGLLVKEAEKVERSRSTSIGENGISSKEHLEELIETVERIKEEDKYLIQSVIGKVKSIDESKEVLPALVEDEDDGTGEANLLAIYNDMSFLVEIIMKIAERYESVATELEKVVGIAKQMVE